MKLGAHQIAEATGGRLVTDAAAGPVLTDTRTLQPGCWFLALSGARFDGHDYLAQAEAAGAVGCIVSRPISGWSGGQVLVADTQRALQDLGRYARDRVTGPVVGLTGSSGKTTTRALLALALSPLGDVHQTVANLNNHLGVPMTLLAAPEEAAATVVEMGTSSPGEIAVLADIARPDVRLIVNVGPAHLEELGGLDGVAREKGALFTSARPGDRVAVNLDDPRVSAIALPEGARRITWGRHPDADVRLLEATIDGDTLSTVATFRTPSGQVTATIPAPGAHVALDAAGALAVAVGLGVPIHEAAASLAGYQPVGMRMRFEPLASGAVAINDAYNANPQSMEASLAVLASLPGRRVAVLGDMLELGPSEADWHARVVRTAESHGLDLIVLVGPRMAAVDCAVAWRHADPMDAVEPLRAWLGPGDKVLFKGSRGARVERILQSLQGDAGER